MAVTPQEIMKKREIENQPIIEAADKYIESYLMHAYVGKPVKIRFADIRDDVKKEGILTDAIFETVAQKYRQAGWNVTAGLQETSERNEKYNETVYRFSDQKEYKGIQDDYPAEFS